ncbi:methyl-accepting chemotaxis protein [Ferrimonas aestuarii]|uniref:methyl-accepting chemotaxis protein n=1 Tax=Ferrimonas aestuarii TaxID=2569539 RepID=UPI00145E6387|nr:methyl-accepting chemotaxis protein [Ferrimonas aestuarii]
MKLVNLGMLSLRQKLSLSAAIPLIMLFLLTLVAINTSSKLVAADAKVESTHQLIEGVLQIEAAAAQMEAGMRGFLLSGKPSFLAPYEQAKALVFEQLAQLSSVAHSGSQLARSLQEIQSSIQAWIEQVARPSIVLRQGVGTTATMAEVVNLVSQAQGERHFQAINQQVLALIEYERQLMEQQKEQAHALSAQSNQVLVVGGVSAGLLTILVCYGVYRSVMGPVKRMGLAMEQLAIGDLTQTVAVDTDDELGQMAKHYNHAVLQTQEAMRSILALSEEVTAGTESIEQRNSAMASDLLRQAEQVNEIVVSMEQMVASITEVAHQSVSASDSAKQAGVIANGGGAVVQDTVEGMELIHAAVAASSSSVAELGSRGQEIGSVIQVINSIAEQTNLLALNAAIEAARAGQAGRGFSVVADEVRALAERTTEATRTIEQVIESIQSETGLAMNQMTQGSEQVQQGVSLARQAGHSLDEIVEGTEEVSSMIDSIASATEEQSQASQVITDSVEAVSKVCEMAKEQSRLAAESAMDLAQRSQQMRDKLVNFRVA